MPRPRPLVSRLTAFSVFACALLAGGFAGATELYKWTDANGVVHYSDAPPAQGADAAKRVRLNGTESPAPPPEQKPAEATADKPQQQAPEALPDTPEGRKRLCEQAQSQVDLLQSKFQVGDASGKPLDDKARAERTAQAKQAAATYCQNPG